MKKFRIFISSVQTEFLEERKSIVEYIKDNSLLSKYFDVFLFETLNATDKNPQELYLYEVKKSDIYLGLFGNQYGNIISKGLSATHLEYNCATKNKIVRFIFIKSKTYTLLSNL